MRVYLAGPDVFLPEPGRRGQALKAICAGHGLHGIFPLDDLPDEPAAWSALPAARQIALRNEAHIRRAAALIANLTPFRGPSADVGTVFELGFARALGLPVFAWSNDAQPFTERTLAWLGGAGQADAGQADAGLADAGLADAGLADAGGGHRDRSGMLVEAFGCADNLMIDGAIAASGGALVVADRPVSRWGDLDAFARCVACAADRLRRHAPS